MTRPVLLVVILALSIITTTTVAGVFLHFSSLSQPSAVRVLSSPLLTPMGSDVVGHMVVSTTGASGVLERVVVIDKDGENWIAYPNLSLPSGQSVPVEFVLPNATDDFPVGFRYTGIIISDLGTTYTTFACVIVSTSWGNVPEWSQFMHDAQNTGYAGGYTPISFNRQIWRVQVADSPLDVKGGPILTHNGVVVVVEEEGTSGSQPRVYLIDPSTGDVINTFALEWAGDPTFAPVAAFGLIFFATEDYVLAVDPVGSEVVWSVSSDEIGDKIMLKPDSSLPYFGYLGIYDDRLLMYTLYFNGSSSKPYKPAVVCFDAHSGAILWEVTLGNGYYSSGFHANSPVVADGAIWFVDWYGYVWGINIDDGSLRMSLYTGRPIAQWTGAAYYNGFLFYIDTNYYLNAIDTIVPEVAWRQSIGYTVSSPVVALDKVFAASNSYVYAFDYRNGELQWKRPVNNLNTPFIVANGYVYVVCASQWLYIFNADTGEEVFRYQYGWFTDWQNIAWSTSLFLYDGNIYYIDYSGGLHAITE